MAIKLISTTIFSVANKCRKVEVIGACTVIARFRRTESTIITPRTRSSSGSSGDGSSTLSASSSISVKVISEPYLWTRGHADKRRPPPHEL
uniref:Uncharacterized protein n=1 Tax=Trichogramma kaykai TaxID=54128 RepID=A0ABD2X074_9HYME